MIRRITILHSLYAGAFALALFLRLFRLGAAPLSDFEAGWALQPLSLAQGEMVTLGSQPAYILLTGLLFSLLGSTNFLARLIPALAGSVLVLLPAALSLDAGKTSPGEIVSSHSGSSQLRVAGLVLAYGLAIDPGLVALSRLAGGPIMAVSFGLLAAALIYRRNAVLGGIAAGLALLSGPALWQGLLGLALAGVLGALLTRWGKLGRLPNLQSQDATEPEAESPLSRFTNRLLLAGVGTLLVAGTLFLRVPQGLGALAGSLPDYFSGWTNYSSIPPLRSLAALLVYQPLVLLFGILAIGRGWFSINPNEPDPRLARWLSLWAGSAVVLGLIYPGRQPGDLAWALTPFWALAALELARAISVQMDTTTRWIAFGQAALIFIFIALAWLNLLSQARLQTNLWLYWAVTGAALGMALILTILIAAGWSAIAARSGLTWGVAMALTLGMLAAGWGLSQLRPNSVRELWSIPPEAGQLDLLVNTLQDFSSRQTGQRDMLDVLFTVDSPSIRWALRNFSGARYSSDLNSAAAPAVMITSLDQESPSLLESYRGQDLVGWIEPGWQGNLPPNLISWLAFRLAPTQPGHIILWVRSDLFPGGIPAFEGSNLQEPVP